jgi:hypothetical protein
MNKTAILLMTCEKYSKAWNPFFTLFNKYWPDCPYKLYMGTDTGNFPGVNVLSPGKDLGWTNNCIYALNNIDADRIIFFQEDFLIYKKVNTELVKQYVEYAHNNDIGCLRLCPCPGPKFPWEHMPKTFGILNKNDNYYVSLQTAIWDKEILLYLLVPGQNIWHFESDINAKRAHNIKKPFISVWREEDSPPGGPIKYFVTAITRGIWEPAAIDLLIKENIPVDGIKND